MKSYFTLSLIILLTVTGALFGNSITYDIRNETENRAALSNQAISQVVSDALNLAGQEDLYSKARVMVYAKKNSQIDYYIVYLLHRHTYDAEIFRLDVERDNSISVIKDYVEERSREEAESCQTCPDETVEIVVSSFEPEANSHPANDAVSECYDDLIAAGINAVELYGNGESLEAIKNWLSCENVKLWGRIGHGVSNGTIILGDGSLTPSIVSSMDLNNKYMIINSCFVHNQAMIPKMMDDADAYFFCSGDNESLPMYSSEPVWHNAIKKGVLEDIEFGKALEDAGEEGDMRLYGYTRNPDANGACYWADVTAGMIGLSSPNGGNEYAVTSSVDITWTSNSEEKVSLFLCKGSSVAVTIIENTENDGLHTWKIPQDIEEGSDYKIRAEADTLVDESDATFSIKQKPAIVCKNDMQSETLDTTGLSKDKKLTIKNDGKGSLNFSASIGGAAAQIMINELFVSETSMYDGLELRNSGGDFDMTGWKVDWMDNQNTAGSYTFESGYIFPAGKLIVLMDEEDQANASTFYVGGNMYWDQGTTELSVALLDPDGNGVDFVRSSGNNTTPPTGTEWNGDGVSLSNDFAYRNKNEDTDDASDWSLGSSATPHELNPGQSVRAAYWLSISPDEETVSPNSEDFITMTFNSAELAMGEYHDTITIVHDDPDKESPILVPVKLTIVEHTGISLHIGAKVHTFGISCRGPMIAYQIPDGNSGKMVSLKLYNLKGKLVRTLVNDKRNSGKHIIHLDSFMKTKPLATGNYICHMKADGFTRAINVLLR